MSIVPAIDSFYFDLKVNSEIPIPQILVQSF